MANFLLKSSLLLISLLICSGASFAATAGGGDVTRPVGIPGKYLGTLKGGVMCANVPNEICFVVYIPDQMNNIQNPLNTLSGAPVSSMVVFNKPDDAKMDTDEDQVEAMVDIDAVVKLDLEDENISKYVIKTKPTTRKVSEREAFKWLYEECKKLEASNDQLQQMARP